MLSDQDITDAFVTRVGEPPDQAQLAAYRNYTIEELHAVLDRRLAIEQDPTYVQRVAEDYQKFMAATEEERAVWKHPEPYPAP